MINSNLRLYLFDTQIGSEGRNYFINSYTLASGFAYISSLNEVFMCFQRVEMSLGGITSFRDIPLMKHHFFTSRVAVRAELCYKLCFFWGMSIVACKACCDFDKSLYDAITAPLAYDGSLWRTWLTVYSSLFDSYVSFHVDELMLLHQFIRSTASN